jgi:hypothetical protein
MQAQKEKGSTTSCTECQRRKQKVRSEYYRAGAANHATSAHGNGRAITARQEKYLIYASLDRRKPSKPRRRLTIGTLDLPRHELHCGIL